MGPEEHQEEEESVKLTDKELAALVKEVDELMDDLPVDEYAEAAEEAVRYRKILEALEELVEARKRTGAIARLVSFKEGITQLEDEIAAIRSFVQPPIPRNP